MGQAGEKLTQSKSFSLEKIFVTCWHVLLMRKRLGLGEHRKDGDFNKDSSELKVLAIKLIQK